MRVRITRTLTGSIDGIQLSRLSRGQVYDVNTSLACYLLSEEMAEPALSDEPLSILPVEKKLFEPPAAPRTGLVRPRSLADDRRRSQKRRKKPES